LKKHFVLLSWAERNLGRYEHAHARRARARAPRAPYDSVLHNYFYFSRAPRTRRGLTWDSHPRTAGTGTIQYPLFFRRQSIIGRAIPAVLTVGLDCPSRLLDAWTALPQAMRSCGLRSSCGSRIDGGTAVRQRRWPASAG
jgi:hypothetical protein